MNSQIGHPPPPLATTNKRTAEPTNGDKVTTGSAVVNKRAKPKQTLSCQECRRLKLKCDRVFPCSSCQKRGCADICPDGTVGPPGRAVRLAAELTALLHRVEHLENVIVELGHAERIPPPLNLEEAVKRSTTITKDLEDEIAGRRPRRMASGEQEEESAQSADEAVDSVLGGVGSLSIAESGRTRFLGTSAGSAYYELVSYDDDDEDPGTESPTAPSESETAEPIIRYPFIQFGPTYHKAAEVERLRSYLPPMEEARRLGSNYWRFLAFQFTPLEEKVFWDDYLPAAYTPEDPRATKLACVFAILAIGSVFDPEAPATPNASAHEYSVLCQATLGASRFLANNDLAASKTLQLLANYYLNAHDLREGGETYYPVLGMSLRLLVTQGLHRDPVKFGLTDEVEINRRRRVFWELIGFERMQAFISGRPYMLSDRHYDTQFPSDATTYDRAKWSIGRLIGVVIDEAFAIASPSYGTILKLDQRVRDLVKETPDDYRSGALPVGAFAVRPQNVPQLPDAPDEALDAKDKIHRLRAHTLDQIFGQVLFYLHKPAFAQALLKFSDEPLKSPWSASVAAVSLETGVYLLAVAKSWIRIDPVLCPRWWHIYFHAFAASVAQSSLVIQSPRSQLAPHAWSQLNEAVRIFEEAGSGGAPVAAFVPRLRILLEKAYLSLQNVITVPRGLGGSDGSGSDLASRLAEGTDVSLSILAPPTRLDRGTRRRSTPTSISPSAMGSASPENLARSPVSRLTENKRTESATEHQGYNLSSLPMSSVHDDTEYSPYDSPILLNGGVKATGGLLRDSPRGVVPLQQPKLPVPPLAAAISVPPLSSSTTFELSAMYQYSQLDPGYAALMPVLQQSPSADRPDLGLRMPFETFATPFATDLPALATMPSTNNQTGTPGFPNFSMPGDVSGDGIDWSWFGLQGGDAMPGQQLQHGSMQ